MNIIFEVHRNASSIRPWISLLLFGTLLNALSMTKTYSENNRSRNIGGLVVSIYTVVLCTVALIAIIMKKKMYKYILPFGVFLIYLAVFLYTAYQDRSEYEHTSSYDERAPIIGHHAGVFLFSGIFVVLLELFISPPMANLSFSRIMPKRTRLMKKN